MKAAQINEYGDASAIILNPSAPTPKAGKDEVVVKVQYASLNPVDSSLRNGYMHQSTPLTFPITLGGDLAGTVSEVGAEVTAFKVGDKVYGQSIPLAGGSGSFAEFAMAPANRLSPVPANLSFREAAAAPLTGISAIQALTEHIKLQAGQKILILGGSGGIGTMAIQLAKHIGAHVAVTVRGTDSAQYVFEIGADDIIDTSIGEDTSDLADFDAVLDLVGGESAKQAFATLREGGTFVSLVGATTPELSQQFKVTAINQNGSVTSKRLTALTELIESEAIDISVEKEFSLDQVRQAFEAREEGGIKGKIVIKIGE